MYGDYDMCNLVSIVLARPLGRRTDSARTAHGRRTDGARTAHGQTADDTDVLTHLKNEDTHFNCYE